MYRHILGFFTFPATDAIEMEKAIESKQAFLWFHIEIMIPH